MTEDEEKTPHCSEDKEKLLEQFMSEDRKERIEHVLRHRTDSLVIVLEQVHNFHNISAVIRSADAFGIQRIVLIGDEFEYSRGITLGSERWVDVIRCRTPQEAVQTLRNEGFRLVVLQPEDYQHKGITYKSIPVYELPFEQKLALIFGNEREGVSPELAAECDMHAYIPMFGFVDSLNISVAAAVCMFSSTISGTERSEGPAPLAEDRRRSVHNSWLRKAVKRSDTILREIDNDRE